MFPCEVCRRSFSRKSVLTRHYKSALHIKRANKVDTKIYSCACGKMYTYSQSLFVHKSTCTVVNQTELVQQLETEKDEIKLKLLESEKDRSEMKTQIEKLLGGESNHAKTTQNIDTQNNITIHINAFGKENLDYITDKMIIRCIDRIYSSIPCLIEKIHFDPEHPENHNIKITNKKFPYASVMDDNRNWKTVDRKHAIESLVEKGFNILDDKYKENKTELSDNRRQHFETFISKYEDEDKELHKRLKSEIDLMVLNRIVD